MLCDVTWVVLQLYYLKSTCDVNLLSKLSIIFKKWRVIVLFVLLRSHPQGANNLILCTLDTIHRLFFVTRLIINKINKVQWVDFKLENVLVSLHALKTMGLGFIIFKEWRVTWTFSYTTVWTDTMSYVVSYIVKIHNNESPIYWCLFE